MPKKTAKILVITPKQSVWITRLFLAEKVMKARHISMICLLQRRLFFMSIQLTVLVALSEVLHLFYRHKINVR